MKQVIDAFHSFTDAHMYEWIFMKIFIETVCRIFPLSGTAKKHASLTETFSILWLEVKEAHT